MKKLLLGSFVFLLIIGGLLFIPQVRATTTDATTSPVIATSTASTTAELQAELDFLREKLAELITLLKEKLANQQANQNYRPSNSGGGSGSSGGSSGGSGGGQQGLGQQPQGNQVLPSQSYPPYNPASYNDPIVDTSYNPAQDLADSPATPLTKEEINSIRGKCSGQIASGEQYSGEARLCVVRRTDKSTKGGVPKLALIMISKSGLVSAVNAISGNPDGWKGGTEATDRAGSAARSKGGLPDGIHKVMGVEYKAAWQKNTGQPNEHTGWVVRLDVSKTTTNRDGFLIHQVFSSGYTQGCVGVETKAEMDQVLKFVKANAPKKLYAFIGDTAAAAPTVAPTAK